MRRSTFTQTSCCTDHSDRPKRLYPTRTDAQHTADYIYSCRGVRLRVYLCDDGRGWHLTSDLGGGGRW